MSGFVRADELLEKEKQAEELTISLGRTWNGLELLRIRRSNASRAAEWTSWSAAGMAAGEPSGAGTASLPRTSWRTSGGMPAWCWMRRTRRS